MQVIVWDIDDVLNDLMRSWFETFWLPSHPDCPFRYEGILENPPHRLLGASLDEYLTSLDAFRLSGVAEQLPPVPEALAWFRQYGDRFRHMALTAAPLRAAPISAAWVTNHFGRWVRSFHFVPSEREGECIPMYDKAKSDYLSWWGKADILVDDSAVNVDAARAIGIRGVLMPRPWNQNRLTIAETFESLARSAQ